MRAWLAVPVFAALGACVPEVEPRNPYDPETPAAQQASGTLRGRVSLRAPGDLSLIRIDVGAHKVGVPIDGDGSFAVGDVEPGVHELRLYDTAEPVRFRARQLPALTVRAGAEVDLGTLDLDLVAGRVVGHVDLLDDRGSRVPPRGGIQIELRDARPAEGGPRYSASQLTSATGDYALEDVPAGSYELVATLEAHVRARPAAAVDVFADQTTAVPDLTLRPLASALVPEGTAMTPDRANEFTRDMSLRLRLRPNGANEIAISNEPNLDAAMRTPLPMVEEHEQAWMLPPGDGRKTIYARLFWPDGTSADLTTEILLDTTPPRRVDVGLEDARTAVTTGMVNLLLTADDRLPDPRVEVSATAEMLVVETPAAAGGAEALLADCPMGGDWQPFQSVLPFLLTAGDGQKVVVVQFRDHAGNLSECVRRTFTVDSTAPDPGGAGLRIDGGAATTRSPLVTLSLSVQGAAEMMISNDPMLADATWEPFVPTRTWVLAAGDGDKTVYAQLRDGARNTTAIIQAQITLDSTAPTAPSMVLAEGDGSENGVTARRAVQLTLGATGATHADVSEDPGFTAATRITTFGSPQPFQLADADGPHRLYARFGDAAGNVSDPVSAGVTLDRVAPFVTVFTVREGVFATATNVTVQLLASSDATAMLLSETAACTAGTWQPVTATSTLPLSAGDGQKTLSARVRDAAGNLSACATALVFLDTTAPGTTAVSLTINAGAVSTRSPNVLLGLAATDATEMMLSSSPSFDGALWEPFVSSRSWVLPAGDGDKTVYAQFRDGARNVSAAVQGRITLDATAPTAGSMVLAEGDGNENGFTVQRGIQVTLGATGATYAEVAEDPSFSTATRVTTLGSPQPFQLSDTDGLHRVYARFGDAAGNVSATLEAAVTLDRVPPTLALFAVREGAFSTGSTVTLQLAGTDAAQMLLSETADCSAGTWQTFSTTATFALSAGDGEKTLSARLRDAGGNVSACANTSVTVDSTPPAMGGTPLLINGGATTTRAAAVTLSFSVAGATQMRLSNDGAFTGAPWEGYATSRGWGLAAGDGAKTVFAQFRDAAGNTGAVVQASITLDGTAPSAASMALAEGDGNENGATASRTVQLTLGATGATYAEVAEDPGFTAATRVTTFGSPQPFALSDVDGLHRIYARFGDAAGNVSDAISASVTLDRVAPALTLLSVREGAFSRASNVTLELVASVDATSMLVSETAACTAGAWQPFASASTFTLSPGDSAKVVSAQVRDAAGNLSACASATTILDTAAPDPGAVGLLVNEGAAFVRARTVLLRLSAPGASEMIVSNDPALAGALWEPFQTTRSWEVTAGDGVKTVYAQFRDQARNTSAIVQAQATLDTTAPEAPSMALAEGDGDENGVVAARTVQLTLGATGATHADVSEDPTFNTATRVTTFGSPQPFTLSDGDGLHRVYARFGDAAGNLSANVVASVTLDRAPPVVGLFSIRGGAVVRTANVTVDIAGTDASRMLLSETADCSAGAWQTFSTTATATLSSGDGAKTLSLRLRDAAGNQSQCVAVQTTLDTTAPSTGGTPIVIQGGAGFTRTAAVTLTLTATGATELLLSNDPTFSGATWEPYTSSRGWALTVGDGAKTVFAQFRDAAGNTSAVVLASITLDGTAPSAASMALSEGDGNENGATASRTVQLTLGATGATYAEVAEDPGFTAATRLTTFGSPQPFSLSDVDGLHRIYARFGDAAGNVSDAISTAVTLDRIAPAGSVAIVQSPFATSATVTLTLSATGADEMLVSETADCSAGAYETYAASRALALSAGDGAKTVSVRYRDRAGNASGCSTATATVDTAAPVAGPTALAVNGGAAFTRSQTVTLTLGATGATQMLLANDGAFTGASWEAFVPTRSWGLSAGDGARTVFAQFRDAAGNASGIVQASITLDSAAPTAASVALTEGDGNENGSTASRTVQLTLGATGASAADASEDPSFTAATRVTTFGSPQPFVLGDADGLHRIYVRFSDAAGNVADAISVTVTLDRAAPTGLSLAIRQSPLSSTRAVTLDLAATGAADMRLSETADCSAGSWQTLTTPSTFTLSAGDGAKTVSAQFRDAAGNASACTNASTTVDSAPPTGTALAINGGAVATRTQAVTLSLAATSATQMRVSLDPNLTGATWEAYATTRAFTLAAGDGAQTVYAEFRDAAGNVASPPAQATITLDTTAPPAPTITLTENDGNENGFTLGRTVRLTLLSAGAATAEASEDPAFSGATTYGALGTAQDFTLADTDGLHRIYVRALDAAGNSSTSSSVTVTLDRAAPSSPSIAVQQGNLVASTAITLTLAAAGADEMIVSETADCSGGAYEAYASTRAITLSTGDGAKTVSVRYRDRAGNVSSCVTAATTLDGTAPAPGAPAASIAGGGTVYTSLVTVNLSATGATQMALSSSSSLTGATWIPYATSASWTLTSGEGTRTVFVRFRDDAGNETATQQASTVVSFRGSVSGVVTREGGGALNGTLVTVNGTTLSGTTDATGAFTITDIPAGIQALSAQAAGFQRYDYALLTVTAGQASNLGSVQLTRLRGTASGQVFLQGQTSHTGAQVTLTGTTYSTFTGPDGAWTMTVPVGNYAGITATKAQYAGGSVASTITVTDVGTAVVAPLTLTATHNNLSGVVNLFGRTDHSGATVALAGQTGTPTAGLSFSRTSPASGAYAFTDLPVGQYTLTLSYQAGWEVITQSVTIAAGAPLTIATVTLRERFVTINANAAFTTSRNVTLALGASDALQMRVSENADLSGSVLETFATTRAFTIASAGDGVKRVYAQFFDSFGTPSSIVYDEITLDTTAVISAVTEDSGGLTRTRDSVITITLNAGEPGGTARADIAGYAANLTLNDDGQSGDGAANDGVYGIRYTVQGPLDVTGATVTGRFTDARGNVATPVNAPGTITIQSPPAITGVTVIPQSSTGTATVTWTTDEPANGQVYWGADNSYTAAGSPMTNAANTTSHSFTLTGLTVSAQYHYRVRSTDAASNMAQTVDATFWVGPNAATNVLAMGGDGRIDITWEAPPQDNVVGYRVSWGAEAGGPFLPLNSTSPTRPTYLLFSDTSLANGTTRHYVVQSIDSFGNVSQPSTSASATARANSGPTSVSGVLPAGNVIWTSSGSPYVITGNTLAPQGSTLVIGPGTVVTQQGATLYTDGAFKILGQKGALVTMNAARLRSDMWGQQAARYSSSLNYVAGNVVGYATLPNGFVADQVAYFFRSQWSLGVSFSYVGLGPSPPGANWSFQGTLIRGCTFASASGQRVQNSRVTSDPGASRLEDSILTGSEPPTASNLTRCHVRPPDLSAPPAHFAVAGGTVTDSIVEVPREYYLCFGTCPTMTRSEIRPLGTFANGWRVIYLGSGSGVLDLRGNYWGGQITSEMQSMGPSANISFIYDYYDDPVTLPRVAYDNWLTAPPTNIGPRDFDLDGVNGPNWGGTDCDDENEDRFPGNPEVPGNGIDEDCNDLTGP